MTEPIKRRRRTRKETMTEWIRLIALPSDKAKLQKIVELSGDDTDSATVRRLIRTEYARLTGSTQVGSQARSEQAA
jgi:hypothetical protein